MQGTFVPHTLNYTIETHLLLPYYISCLWKSMTSVSLGIPTYKLGWQRNTFNLLSVTFITSLLLLYAAVEGGADRLELCGNLIIGGTTPGPWLFDEIRKRSDIRIHALIRPRFGDFCYTDAEFSMIKHAVEDFRKMGAEGVVFG